MAETWEIRRGLWCIEAGTIMCVDCAYNGNPNCKNKVAEDAIELINEQGTEIERLNRLLREKEKGVVKLNEQTPMMPGLAIESNGIFSTCPRCGKKLSAIIKSGGLINHDGKLPEYCEDCGLKIKWD